MDLIEIIWKRPFVEKLAHKHRVSIQEAETVLTKSSLVVRVARGHVGGEDVYEAYGQTLGGRY